VGRLRRSGSDTVTMVVLKRRSRLVTFRVSPEEYEALTEACIAANARSVSEFSRLAVLQRIQALGAPSGNLSGDLTLLSKSLVDLDLALGDIRKKLRVVLGPANDAEGQAAG
jgi:hypothetical protein